MNTKRLIPVLAVLTLLAGAGIAWTEMAHRPRDVEVQVKGMSCEGCASMIRTELEKLSGATDVSVSHESGKASVTIDGWSSTTDQDVSEAIAKAGYEVEKK